MTCRKCGNPAGYDTFWRDGDDPHYACGKCGERETPKKSIAAPCSECGARVLDFHKPGCSHIGVDPEVIVDHCTTCNKPSFGPAGVCSSSSHLPFHWKEERDELKAKVLVYELTLKNLADINPIAKRAAMVDEISRITENPDLTNTEIIQHVQALIQRVPVETLQRK